MVYGDINNEYDDFLGTGRSWWKPSINSSQYSCATDTGSGATLVLAGAQFVRTNYAIDFPPAQTLLDQQIGYMGFDSTGLGLVLAQRHAATTSATPIRGSYFLLDSPFTTRSGEASAGNAGPRTGILDNLPQDDSVLNQ